MQWQTFQERLLKATGYSVNVARRHVNNVLPERIRYMVRLNQSYDGNPLTMGEHVFPNDALSLDERVGPLTTEEVVELLWRDGIVPEWIDISVFRADAEITFLELLCCGRYTDRDDLLYYLDGGVGPFGIKSPSLPLNWRDGDAAFDLHWRDA